MFSGASTRGNSGISSSSYYDGLLDRSRRGLHDAPRAAVRHRSPLNPRALSGPGSSRCSGWLCARGRWRRRRQHSGQPLRARHDDDAREPRRCLGESGALAREVPSRLLQQYGEGASLRDIGEIEGDRRCGRRVPVHDARAAHAFPFGENLTKRDVVRNQRHAAVLEREAQIPGEGEARDGEGEERDEANRRQRARGHDLCPLSRVYAAAPSAPSATPRRSGCNFHARGQPPDAIATPLRARMKSRGEQIKVWISPGRSVRMRNCAAFHDVEVVRWQRGYWPHRVCIASASFLLLCALAPAACGPDSLASRLPLFFR